MPTMVDVSCAGCARVFQKSLSNYNQTERKGKKHYHSKDCALKATSVKITLICSECKEPFERAKRSCRKSRTHPETFCSSRCRTVFRNKKRKGLPNANRDQYSPFREHLNRVKRRSKDKGVEVSLTFEDLRWQWDSQSGVCPYTGWSLVNPGACMSHVEHLPDAASLDRIDSKKGYVVGNIQFVAMIANFAKNNFSEDDLLRFCEAVVLHNAIWLAAKAA